MKKIIFAAAMALVIFMTAAMPEVSEKAETGQEVPRLILKQTDGTLSLSDLKGKHVILHFWSKDDPKSRIDNHYYNRIASQSDDTRYIAVCVDATDEDLSRRIVANDGLDETTQYYLSDVAHATELQAFAGAGATYHITPQSIIEKID